MDRTLVRRLLSPALAAAVAALLAIGMVTPAAAAADPVDQMIAAGLGSAFTAPVGASSFHSSSCFEDPAGDVQELEAGTSVDEGRGDIVEHCVSYDGSTLDLSVLVADPVDPNGEDWAGATIVWLLDTDGDGAADWAFTLAQDESGELGVIVHDRSTTPASEVECDVTAGYAGGYISIAFDATCVGSPSEAAVAPGLVFDQKVTDPNGVATIDIAPNDGGFADPVDDQIDLEGINRINGATRVETAIAVSQAQFGDGEAQNVVLARGDVPADALAGTPLALANNAPILVTAGPDSLPDNTAEEIERVLADGGTIHLLGGEVALSQAVEDAAAAIGTVVRHAGENRFDTAVQIADALGNPSTVMIADGGAFADAVVAGTSSAAAAADGEDVAAVLLSAGSDPAPETDAYLEANEGTAYAIGVAASAAYPDAESIAGDDEIGTSVAVAEAFHEAPGSVGIATNANAADALTGGALVGGSLVGDPGVGPGPMLLTDGEELRDDVAEYLAANADSIEVAYILGGPVAISGDVAAAVSAALSGNAEA